MFLPARLSGLVASLLGLLVLGGRPAAAQEAAAVTILYEGIARPAFCDRHSFVVLSTAQGPLLWSHTIDPTRSNPIDLVMIRRHFGSDQREEVRVPGLNPDSSSDLELYCHEHTAIIDEIISVHSRGVALDWPAGANQAALLAHFIDTPTARPATLMTAIPAEPRSQVYLAGASRP